MKINHICKSGNDFEADVPDVPGSIKPGFSTMLVGWEDAPSEEDIKECEEVLHQHYIAMADHQVKEIETLHVMYPAQSFKPENN